MCKRHFPIYPCFPKRSSKKIISCEYIIGQSLCRRVHFLAAAWQNFEGDRKGTLETGTLADQVVLSDDLLAVDPMKIKDIQALETIKEGQSIYSAKG